jgi:signal transduction histidine kinase
LHGALTLLENLVEWGRIQLQPQPLAPDALTLKDEVSKVFSGLTVQVRLKENRLVNAVDELVTLAFDENILRFIVRNLLTNANKFTDKGAITVTGFMENNKVKLCVTDTGIGMPARMAERLFMSREKFSRRGTP